MSEEEMVPVNLGDDYERGAYFITKNLDSSATGDYLVPRSQVERWQAAKDAYENMQFEIEQAMDAQRDRVNELRAARRGPKSPMQELIEEMYANPIAQALQIPATFRRLADGESE